MDQLRNCSPSHATQQIHLVVIDSGLVDRRVRFQDVRRRCTSSGRCWCDVPDTCDGTRDSDTGREVVQTSAFQDHAAGGLHSDLGIGVVQSGKPTFHSEQGNVAHTLC